MLLSAGISSIAVLISPRERSEVTELSQDLRTQVTADANCGIGGIQDLFRVVVRSRRRRTAIRRRPSMGTLHPQKPPFRAMPPRLSCRTSPTHCSVRSQSFGRRCPTIQQSSEALNLRAFLRTWKLPPVQVSRKKACWL